MKYYPAMESEEILDSRLYCQHTQTCQGKCKLFCNQSCLLSGYLHLVQCIPPDLRRLRNCKDRCSKLLIRLGCLHSSPNLLCHLGSRLDLRRYLGWKPNLLFLSDNYQIHPAHRHYHHPSLHLHHDTHHYRDQLKCQITNQSSLDYIGQIHRRCCHYRHHCLPHLYSRLRLCPRQFR